MTEDDFKANVIDLARTLGWRIHHDRPARTEDGCSPELAPVPLPPGPIPELRPPEIEVPFLELLPHTGPVADMLMLGILAAGLVLAGVLLVLGIRWLWTLEGKR